MVALRRGQKKPKMTLLFYISTNSNRRFKNVFWRTPTPNILETIVCNVAITLSLNKLM